jgi:glutathione synthase/RimK-type ligase-like ATP-grasp enzyme
MTKPRVALVTYRNLPELSPDDEVLRSALDDAGIRAEPAVWDDPGVEWSRFDLVVVRSTWDYHLRLEEFLAWIAARAQDARLSNAPEVLRWNARKTYLAELEARGIAVVPTLWVERGDSSGIGAQVAARGWTDVVIKPVVSASAHGTWLSRVPFDAESEHRFREEVSARSVMVQPLLHEVAAEGELSLMFIGGAFSHAVRKLPRAGDFRVQREHGGSAALVDAPTQVVRAAARALASSPAPTLYARVDGCVVNGKFLLMELELLEPSLFFTCAPGAASRLANEILTRVRGGRD